MAAEGLSAAYNIAAFLGKVKGSDELRYPVRIQAGDKLVLDESSQISTADLDLVLRFADRNGASLIPTGDPEQLGAVGAGGMFRALAERLGAAELREIHRFAQAWEADASLRLHDGDKTALAAYAARARIQGFDREAAMNRAAGAYLAGMLQGKDVLLLAGSNEEAAQLAARVQTGLARLGLVQNPCTPLADGNQAGTGDLLRARLNCTIDAGGRRLTNRDTVRVVGWQYGDAIAVRALPEGGWSSEFVIPRTYLVQSAELIYAGNVHVSQGRTVDVSNLYVSDTLSRESFYVGMTRGREGNFAWTVTGKTAPEGAKPYQQATPESVISGIMDRESRELTAHQEIVQAQEWAGGMGHVLQIWTAAIGETAHDAITASLRTYLSPHEYERYLTEHQRSALDQSLRERQLSGQDIRGLVASITSQPLDGARSVSAVLHGRLAGVPRFHRPDTWADRTPESAPVFAREAAEVMDARTRELGERLVETPEPWLVSYLGMPPSPQESPVLRAEYAARAGKAAAYREAAGIDRQDQAVSLEAHRDRPELEAMRREVIMALEIRDEAEIMRGMTRGDLEARVLEGERAMANAPRDVSAKLRNAAQAQQDYWQQSVEAEIAGNEAEAEGARVLAGLLGREQAGLEKAREAYEDWEGRTARRATWQRRPRRSSSGAERWKRSLQSPRSRRPPGMRSSARRPTRPRRRSSANGRQPPRPGRHGLRSARSPSSRRPCPRIPVRSPRWPERRREAGASPLPALTVYAPSNRALRVTTERVTWSADLAPPAVAASMRAAIAAKVTATSSGGMPMCLISRAIVPIVWESPDSAAWIIPAAIGDSSSCPGIAVTGHLP